MRHKKIYFLTAFFILSLLCGCSFDTARYRNSKEGFSLRLPRGWEVVEGAANMKLFARAPKKSDASYRANIIFTKVDLRDLEVKLNKPLDFDEFFDINKAILLEALPGTKYSLEEKTAYLGVNRGKTLAFKLRLKDASVRYLIGIWLIKKYAYTISCSAQSEEFDKYQQFFKEVLQSLKVK